MTESNELFVEDRVRGIYRMRCEETAECEEVFLCARY